MAKPPSHRSWLFTNGQGFLILGLVGLMISMLAGSCVGGLGKVLPFLAVSTLAIAMGLVLLWLGSRSPREPDDE